MDLVSLATTAISLAQPFLNKIGDGVSKKIGEDIWTLLKKPFIKDKEVEDSILLENPDSFKQQLVIKLKEDLGFQNELASLVEKSQKELSNYTQQNIYNEGTIEKQVNIGQNIGDINL